MNIDLEILALLNFVYIGLLPVAFFKRDGHFNFQWWLTAAPFVADFCAVIAAMFGYLGPAFCRDASCYPIKAILAIVCFAGSIALISFTLGTHRIPIALWHQDNDAPKNIVTYGAYGKIRHPFYASFLLCFLGTALALPHLITSLAFIWGFLVLNQTAAREEKRLQSSEFGKEYQDYIAKTGRFLPKLT